MSKIAELLIGVTKDAAVSKADEAAQHPYQDEAQAVLDAIGSKDVRDLAEALHVFFKSCDADATDEDDTEL